MNFEIKKEREKSIENLSKVEIKTERLILKPVSLEDKEMIFSELTDEVTRYMFPSSPKQIADTEKYIEKIKDEIEKGKSLVMSILGKETNEFMGCGGIHYLDTKTPELGIWIKRSAQNNNYGKEAVAGLREWADQNLEYEYLLYPVVKENIASRKIPESLGGKAEREYASKRANGEDVTLVEYRIYK